MKKLAIVVISILFCIQLNAQTWTVNWDDELDCEWRVITYEQWARLVEQKKVLSNYAIITFIDVLELEDFESPTVLKGTRPELNGHYYLLGTIIPKTDEAREIQNYIGFYQMFLNRNDQTGELSIIFLNEHGITETGALYTRSTEFDNKYNQCLKWVNGE
jgi:hypothetical protein